MLNECRIIYSNKSLSHNILNKNREIPQRFKAIYDILIENGFALKENSIYDRDKVLLFHNKEYVKDLEEFIFSLKDDEIKLRDNDEDTFFKKDSLEAAYHSVYTVLSAVDEITENNMKRVFCLTRPPGHHACVDKSMGFCIFNNIAIGAKYALSKENINKVAIVDFDVHHGNGTQQLAEEDDKILFTSTHQYPLWPFQEDYCKKINDNILNIPIEVNAESSVYIDVFKNKVLPSLRNFKPDLIFISAGFDAHRDEKYIYDKEDTTEYGKQNLTDQEYKIITEMLTDIANEVSFGKIISVLEGGYNTETLAKACLIHIETLFK